MHTPDFATKPTLHGELVTLRPFQPDDVEAIARVLADPEVLRLTGSVPTTAEAEAGDPTPDQRLREWYAARNSQSDRLDLAVVDRASCALVGEVVLNEWDQATGSCNFRTLIGPEGRGRGLGTEAVRLVVGYGFETLGLHRISLEVYAFNPRARRVYDKAGFVHEGTLREVLRFDDEWVDADVMALLESDWRALGH
ncbi:GNAT family N-acetyltransferase [Actinomycetota bacterium]